MERSEQINELAVALLEAQKAIKPAPKDSTNSHLGSHYADLASVWGACRGPLNDNGLAVVQTSEATTLGVMLRTTLIHVTGQWISGLTPLAYDPAKMQSVGSALTYGRRYGLAALVGVIAEEDDDGHAAVSPRQAGEHERHEWGTAHRGPTRPDHSRSRAPGEERQRPSGPPKTGKALFAWAREQSEIHQVDVPKWIGAWAKTKDDYPDRIVDFDQKQVAAAFDAACHKIDSLAEAN